MRFKILAVVLSVFLFGLIMPSHASAATESQLLKEAGDILAKTAESSKDLSQKLAIRNALSELDAAEVALKKKGEEAEKVEKEERVRPAPVTTVTFTALEGDTNINRDYIGEVETIQFLAVDDTEIDPKEVEPDISGHNGSFTISVGKAGKIGSIVLVGTAGIIKLVQDGSGGAYSTFKGIEPKDGSIDLRNGRMNETFNVTKGTTDMVYAPQDHAVTVDGNPVSVIATRVDQIAVSGHNIGVSLGGESQVEITTPSKTILSDRCPAWGYNISLPQAVKINLWVPIMAEVFGLPPTEKVTFHFMPAPGQEIMPTDVTIPAADLVFPPSTVAELKALTPGPQGLNVVVTRQTE